LLAFGVYRPALRFGFVYDDHSTIQENLFLRSPGNALRLLGPGPAAELVPDAGRPTLLLTELLDQALGLRPAGRHVHSLLWHVGVAWLVFWFGRRWLGQVWPALAAGALFVVHPLFVEAVAVVSNREDPIAAFFVLATLVVLRGDWGTARRRRLAAMGLALLGLLAKENAMALPGLLLVLDLGAHDEAGGAPREAGSARRLVGGDGTAAARRSRLLDTVALFVVSLAAAAWRAWVMGAPLVVSRTAEVDAPDLATRLGLGAWTLGQGLTQFLVPVTLLPEYPDPPSHAWWVGALAAAAVLALAGAVWWRRGGQPAGEPTGLRAELALAACVVAYAPNLGFAAITNLRADRYFYLPGVFLCVAASALVARRLAVRGRRAWQDAPRVVWLALAGVLLALATRTAFQLRIWRDDMALWTAGTRGAPDSARAWLGLADAHLRAGDTLRAAAAARRAQELSDDAETRELLGVIHLTQGDLAGAAVHLEAGLRRSNVRPGGQPTATLLNNLGYVHLRRGEHAAARARFTEARQLAPHFDRPWVNGAEAARASGHLGESRALLEELLRRAPGHPEALRALAKLRRP
jgi:tetratricopeptide (TPR) repeat protein